MMRCKEEEEEDHGKQRFFKGSGLAVIESHRDLVMTV
jgi:hypothetical protein